MNSNFKWIKQRLGNATMYKIYLSMTFFFVTQSLYGMSILKPSLAVLNGVGAEVDSQLLTIEVDIDSPSDIHQKNWFYGWGDTLRLFARQLVGGASVASTSNPEARESLFGEDLVSFESVPMAELSEYVQKVHDRLVRRGQKQKLLIYFDSNSGKEDPRFFVAIKNRKEEAVSAATNKAVGTAAIHRSKYDKDYYRIYKRYPNRQ